MHNKNVVKFTEDGTQDSLVTEGNQTGVSIVVTAASNLGGGALDLLVRPARSNETPEAVEPLTVGQRNMFLVGNDVEVSLRLAGATAPDVTVFVTPT